ncbi:hypothetical protein F5Y19DRAFT_477111 [Xylariaceae sp. FL1651]|nr:hypothetical protein F5Y19DRAFT_477111 [Xylariaceae sp. FL1651]
MLYGSRAIVDEFDELIFDARSPTISIGPVRHQQTPQQVGPQMPPSNVESSPITLSRLAYHRRPGLSDILRVPQHTSQSSTPTSGLLQATPPTSGFSMNYRGSRTRNENRSQNIPEEANTSVWIYGLPPMCDHAMLLGALRGTGKIYACVVNPAEGRYTAAAAKVVFWNRAGVDRLYNKVLHGGFTFDGDWAPVVEPNRIKTCAQPESERSRVILIRGPRSIVNFARLAGLFLESIQYQLEDVQDFQLLGGMAAMIWTFGSYRLQAESAYKKIARLVKEAHDRQEDREGWNLVRIIWGDDPCGLQDEIIGQRQ